MMGLTGQRKRIVTRRAVAGLAVCALAWAGRAGAAAPQPPARERPTAETADTRVDFTFDRVEIPVFARLVGEITGFRIVVSDTVKGQVTVVSPRVRREEVFPLFASVIESAGCSVIREGDLYRVVALERGPTAVAPVLGPDEAVPESGIVTKVFRLEHVSAAAVKQAAAPGAAGAPAGAIAALEETNHLLVTDTAAGIRRVEKLLALVDRPGAARGMEVVPLRFAAAEDLADQLGAAMAESETRAEAIRQRLPSVRPPAAAGSGRGSPSVVASPEANRLILVGTPQQIAVLKDLIERMDVDGSRGRLNAIFLKYIPAEQAAKSLGALLGRPDPKSGGSAAPSARRLAIEASAENNALLVDASYGDFENVKRLIEQLDVPRQQVHIEVVIAEVRGAESLNLGVQFASVDMPGKVGQTVLQGASLPMETATTILDSIQKGVFPNGISVAGAHGSSIGADGKIVTSYPFALNIEAIRKTGRARILSTTALEAQNNMEASIHIVNQIPILKSTIAGGSGTARDVIQNIERIDVGIKLKLTPHVIPGGEVQMELNPVIEAVLEPATGGESFTPTIARREVSTTVTVPDGKTIVIAGLTRHDKNDVVRRIPLLGSLPLVGWLFRHTTTADDRTDMLIFVTPRLVGDAAAARAVAEEWKRKTGLDSDEQR